MFGKSYELPLNKNYVRHWGLLEAVRELIQNSIDSNSPFEYEFMREDDDLYTLILRSEFETLSAKTLLLGSTSKTDDPEAIGSFGEGYKIALLVLTRCGNPVHIQNGPNLWRPSFKFSKKFECEVLVIDEEPSPFKASGLEFSVSNLSSEEVERIKDSCLQMQSDIGEIKSTSYGQILMDGKHAGKLYVGGLYICKTELKFGYNIKPEFIKLERDRQTVDSFDLRYLTKEMWLQTKETELIVELIESECKDLELAQYGMPEMIKEECYKVFKARNPGSVVATSQKEFKELVAKGLEKVVYVGVVMGTAIKDSASYKREIPVAVETINQYLERWFNKHKYNMHDRVRTAFRNEIIEQSKHWRRQ